VQQTNQSSKIKSRGTEISVPESNDVSGMRHFYCTKFSKSGINCNWSPKKKNKPKNHTVTVQASHRECKMDTTQTNDRTTITEMHCKTKGLRYDGL